MVVVAIVVDRPSPGRRIGRVAVKPSKASKESDVDPEIGAAGWVLTVVTVSQGLNEMIWDESRGSRVIRVRVRDGSAWEVVDVVRAYVCVCENRNWIWSRSLFC
jgi:hypothetical protein